MIQGSPATVAHNVLWLITSKAKEGGVREKKRERKGKEKRGRKQVIINDAKCIVN